MTADPSNGSPRRHTHRRGVALVIVLLVVMAVVAIASGAAFLGLNSTLISKYHNRLSLLETAADAALEEGRSALNANPASFPAAGFVVYENQITPTDAAGIAIAGIKRSTYIGPTGITSGQFGVFASIVTVVTDASGNRLVRRAETVQESFAKYAYFTAIEGAIVFGANDVIYGPVHSNDNIQIRAALPGATFWGFLKTTGTITNLASGHYHAGYQENAPSIPFPTTAGLNKLLVQATAGGTNFTSSTAGSAGASSMRIEFVALDLNSDGDSTDVDEGFMKIYQVAAPSNAWFVVADTTANFSANGLKQSANCGHISATGTASHAEFKTFRHHGAGATQELNGWAVNNGTARHCYLGGSDILNDWTTTPGHGAFLATDSLGSWSAWTGTIDSRVSAARPYDAGYLWPISRALNPNFKGVIHVTGKVAVSGKVRGAITLAATGNIIIADHLTYVSNPGGTIPCNSPIKDMIGLFSGADVVVADNLLNAPYQPTTAGAHRTWASRGSDEYIHGVILALGRFTAENYANGPTDVEDCQGANDARGCLYLTGGIIQYQRGPVGLTNGAGYIKRYQYDACAGMNPPPYFPTTGHFVRGHYYEVEPVNFNIDTYWQRLIPHN